MTEKKTQTPNTDNPKKMAGGITSVHGGALEKWLLKDIRTLIEQARATVAVAVNAGLTMLYWQIGARIRQDVLRELRAGYGKRIIATLGRQLEVEFGRGFEEKNLRRMVQFAEAYPDVEIVAALRRQLGWAHFKQLIPMRDPLQRDFYSEMCRLERWSTRTLQKKIQSMLFERTALSRKPAKLAARELKALREEDRLTPDLVFRDPYILDFLGLKDTYAEKDVETAILREMEAFILELGADFCFVARQKRMQIDETDYYLDLLFYHRALRRLVAIDLKLGKLEAADKGQMELYLRWLDLHDRRAQEEAPLGLILCAGKTAEHVKLLRLESSGIRVAEYLTELPPRKLLERKLHQAIQVARERLTDREKVPAVKALPRQGKGR